MRDERLLVDLVTDAWAGLEPLVMNKAKFSRTRSKSSPIVTKSIAAKKYHVIPGWQTSGAPHPQGISSFVRVVRRGKFDSGSS